MFYVRVRLRETGAASVMSGIRVQIKVYEGKIESEGMAKSMY